MIRPFTCVCFLLACGSGLYLYQAKHRVQMIDREIEKTVRATDELREQTRVLHAEWTLLNDPQRLQALADQFLNLKTVTPGQFTSMAELDNRLPAVRAPEPRAARAACAGGRCAEPPAAAESPHRRPPFRCLRPSQPWRWPSLPPPPRPPEHKPRRRVRRSPRRRRYGATAVPPACRPVVAADAAAARRRRRSSCIRARTAADWAGRGSALGMARSASACRRRGRCRSAPRNGSTSGGGG